MVKYSKIVSLAKNCKANVEKYKKAHTGNYDYAVLGYLFSKSILNLSKDVGIKEVPLVNNPTGTSIDEKIDKENYLKLCQLYVNWVDKNGKCPSYLAYGTQKIAPWVWTYASARILIYYSTNKKLPSAVLVSYKPFLGSIYTSTISYSKIVSLATNVKKNVEKYKKAYTGSYNSETLAYLFSKSILAPKDNLVGRTIKANDNPQSTQIDGGIGINNFKKLCQLYVNWCEKNNNTAPSYVKFNNHKIGIDVFTYAVARVVWYYHEKGKFPNKVLVSWKTFYVPPKEEPKPEPEPEPSINFEKHGHAEDYGCDAMGQNNGYYCACHSLQEVIRNLTGKFIYQDTIAEIAGTTEDGTDHEGMNTVIAWFNRDYDYNLSVEWKNFSEIGWEGVNHIVNSNNQDCVIHNLYRNQYGHYEVVNWVSDENVGVQNSLGDRCGYPCYCGYKETRSRGEFNSYISGISQKSVMIITNK